MTMNDYDTRQNYIASRLPALAAALAQHIPNTTWVCEPAYTGRPVAILRQKDSHLAFQFLIHPPHNNTPDLFTCRPHLVDHEGDVVVPDDLKINVSLSRSDASLVRDINRRLISLWRLELPKWLDRVKSREQSVRQKEDAVLTIVRATNHSSSPMGRDHSSFHLDLGGANINLTVGSGGMVELRSRYLTAKQAVAVIQALRSAG